MTSNTEKYCENCDYCGMDMDGKYCVAPPVLDKHRYGLSLASLAITEFCPAPNLPLWQIRRPR